MSYIYWGWRYIICRAVSSSEDLKQSRHILAFPVQNLAYRVGVKLEEWQILAFSCRFMDSLWCQNWCQWCQGLTIPTFQIMGFLWCQIWCHWCQMLTLLTFPKREQQIISYSCTVRQKQSETLFFPVMHYYFCLHRINTLNTTELYTYQKEVFLLILWV